MIPPATTIWTENESMNFGYLGVSAGVQTGLFATTGHDPSRRRR